MNEETFSLALESFTSFYTGDAQIRKIVEKRRNIDSRSVRKVQQFKMFENHLKGAKDWNRLECFFNVSIVFLQSQDFRAMTSVAVIGSVGETH